MPAILRTASKSKTVRKAARKTGGKVAKKVAKTRPVKRSLILIGVAVAAVTAGFVAKKALGGGGDETPDTTSNDVDRASATWSPSSVSSPASKESASAGPNGGSADEVTGSGSDSSTTEPESVPTTSESNGTDKDA